MVLIKNNPETNGKKTLVEKIISFFYRGCEQITLPYRPDYINRASRGAGFQILVLDKRKYLLSHTINGEPLALGKIQGKIMEETRGCCLYLKRYDKLSAQERTNLSEKLHPFQTQESTDLL